MDYITINTDALNMTDDEFFNFCIQNSNLRIERDSNQNIIIMHPTGNITSNRNINIGSLLYIWNRKHSLGYVFDSNAGFTLPDKSMRSPDAAWIKKERWEKISMEDRERFTHICPDFIIELKSASDSINQLKEKMQEWMENGCRLGWLIMPDERKSIIYRANGTQEEVTFEKKLSGEDVLPGFELDLKEL